nr:hypothetical protein [Alcaligenes faecalis]
MADGFSIILVDVFKSFDPLNGCFYGQERLNDIARRARRQLAGGRTLEQLIDGVGDIKTVIDVHTGSLEEEREKQAQKKINELRDMILGVEHMSLRGEKFYAPEEYFEYRSLFSGHDGRFEFSGDIESIGFPAIDDQYTDLELFQFGFDVDDDEWRDLKDADEKEFYAIFSLWKLDEVHRLSKMKQSFMATTADGDLEVVTTAIPKGSEHYLWRLSTVKDVALEAMEAVCYAEHLQQMQQHRTALEKTVRSEISDRARKAARLNKKHREVRQLKTELTDWYFSNRDEYQSLSNEKVAELGIKIVPLPYRTIRDTIAAIRKTLHLAG